MATVLACIHFTEFHFKSDDKYILESMAKLDAIMTEELYRRRYVERYDESGWPDAWDKMQKAESNGVTFGEALQRGLLQLFTIRFAVVHRLIQSAWIIFSAGYVWFLAEMVRVNSPLGLVQFTLLAGFLTAAITFVNFTISLRVITINTQGIMDLFKANIRQLRKTDPVYARFEEDCMTRYAEEQEKLREYEGRELFPTIKIRDGYTRTIRNFFLWRTFILSTLNMVTLLPFVLVSWPIAIVMSSWEDAELNAWFTQISVGLAVAPVAYCLVIAIAYFVLERLQVLAGLISTGLFLAVFPPLVNYAVGGEVGPEAIVSSVIAGMAGILSSAIAEMVKKRPSVEVPK